MTERNSKDTRIIEEGESAPTREDFAEALYLMYTALQERGYDPVQQIAYYLLTGEPAYITAHRNARALTAHLERDEIVEELVRFYVSTHPSMKEDQSSDR
ncbi:MAG: IreB family regulatory phosphoprotein [Bacillota bacterium]